MPLDFQRSLKLILQSSEMSVFMPTTLITQTARSTVCSLKGMKDVSHFSLLSGKLQLERSLQSTTVTKLVHQKFEGGRSHSAFVLPPTVLGS